MNWDRIEGNWKQIKGQIRERWGKLTDDDLDRINGKREALVGRLQELYGIKKEAIEGQLQEWERHQPDRPADRPVERPVAHP